MDKLWYNYFTLISVDLAQYKIFRAKVRNFLQGWFKYDYIFFSGVLQSMPGVSKDMNGYRDFEGGHLRTSSYAK